MNFFRKHKNPLLTAVLFTCLLCIIFTAVLAVNAYLFSKKPNVLLIVVDSLRADHMGCYGYSRATTPRIDEELAGKGAVFLNAFSQAPWTKPSVGTIFTSLYPHDADMNNMNTVLPDELVTLAEALKRKGYTTVAFHTTYWVSKIFNTDQGFDEYHELVNLKAGNADQAPELTDKFIEWLEKNQDKKFFAYLHYIDPHMPYSAPRNYNAMFVADPSKLQKRPTSLNPFRRGWSMNKPKTISRGWDPEVSRNVTEASKQQIIDFYDAEIRFTDEALGRLFAKLRALKVMDDTLIIFTADHGEEFWDHGTYEHGHTLYDEVIRVPLIIKHSRLIPSRKIDPIAGLIDLYPTIMDITSLPCDKMLKGISLMPAIMNNAAARETIFFEGIMANRGSERNAMLNAKWKLIHYLEPEDQAPELYDLQNDNRERKNIALQYPDTLDDMNLKIDEWRKNRVKLQIKVEHIQLEEHGLEQLRALGYLQ